MKQLFALMLVCLLLNSCGKKYVDPSTVKYCRFSLYGENNVMGRTYLLRNDSLFDQSPDIHRSGLLNDEQYKKAEKVMNEIPSVFSKHKDVNYTCWCSSFKKIYIEYQDNDKLYSSYIDLDAKNPPRKVTVFADKVYKLIKELEQ